MATDRARLRRAREAVQNAVQDLLAAVAVHEDTLFEAALMRLAAARERVDELMWPTLELPGEGKA